MQGAVVAGLDVRAKGCKQGPGGLAPPRGGELGLAHAAKPKRAQEGTKRAACGAVGQVVDAQGRRVAGEEDGAGGGFGTGHGADVDEGDAGRGALQVGEAPEQIALVTLGFGAEHPLQERPQRHHAAEVPRRAGEHQRARTIEQGHALPPQALQRVLAERVEAGAFGLVPCTLEVALEGREAPVEGEVVHREPRAHTRQPQQKGPPLSGLHLRLDGLQARAAAKLQQHPWLEEGHLTRHAHEVGEVEVDAPVEAADELGARW
jgi:hypothetical protein